MNDLVMHVYNECHSDFKKNSTRNTSLLFAVTDSLRLSGLAPGIFILISDSLGKELNHDD